MSLPNRVWPNVPAPETELPEREGQDLLGGTDPAGQRVRGFQPQTDGNPAGELPGIPLAVIGRKAE